MSEASPTNSKQNEEPEDPVELMLKKTGCMELHYKVQVSEQSFESLTKFGED